MLIEAALATPVFLLLVFAIVELGSLMMDYGGAANIVRSGARTAAVAGNDPTADATILAALARDGANLNNASLQRVVIWHASGPHDTPSAACKNGTSVSDDGSDALGACNVYNAPTGSAGAFAHASGDPATYFGCDPADPKPQQLDCAWPGRDRCVVLTPSGATPPALCNQREPDYVGIWVKVRHRYVTGLFGASRTITDQAIIPLEPQTYALAG